MVSLPTDSPSEGSSNPSEPVTIREKLRALHADEFAQIALTQKGKNVTGTLTEAYLDSVWGDLSLYFTFLKKAWSSVWTGITSLELLKNPTALFVAVFFALGATVVLLFFLIFCAFAKLPPIRYGFTVYSRNNANGLSLINFMNPNMFRELTKEQFQAAKASLSEPIEASPNNNELRVFDLDVARVLLQLSSLMYERGVESINAGLRACARNEEKKSTSTAPTSQPGQLLREIFGTQAANEINKALHSEPAEAALAGFAKRYGMEYSPVSELNSYGSSFSAIFWDPESTWIILAFKGTSPTEFDEWVSDFSYALASIGDWIEGFNSVHGGFKERIWPATVMVNRRRPYDTIAASVKLVADELAKNHRPGTKINVWVTGHSLGCAVASLAYARTVKNDADFGQNAILRDAYLFAAPIVCDVPSMHAFNQAMTAKATEPRTMWRITNAEDVVATKLPELGDRPDVHLESSNLFAFAHLGTEIRMRSKPEACHFTGPHLPRTTQVIIGSRLVDTALGFGSGLRRELAALQWFVGGGLIAHATTHYWDQLMRIGLGVCEWVDN